MDIMQQQAAFPTKSFAPGFKLQDVYGTGTLPYLKWVQMVKTGERTITPGDPTDDVNIDRYNMEAQQTGAMSFGDMMKGIAPSVASLGATAMFDAGALPFVKTGDPYVQDLAYMDRLGIAAKQAALPDVVPLSKTQINPSGTPLAGVPAQKQVEQQVDLGYRLAETPQLGGLGKIPEGFEFRAELANPGVAQATGNIDLFNKLNATRQLGGMGDPARLGGRTFQTPEGPIAVNPGLGRVASIPGPRGGSQGAYVYRDSDIVSAQSDLTSQGKTSNLVAEAITPGMEAPGFLEKAGSELFSGANWGRAAVGATAGFFTALITGQDPAAAARQAIGAGIGNVIGTAVAGPFGGLIFGTIGAQLTKKRVICNELVRQGLMSREHMMLDYKFTKEHLTPQHVRGYHFWAVPVVRKMREGKSVGFWRHIATHRANEIAHIYGKRDKPDYLGKVYRRIFEPACWVVGAICKQKDWQSLYSTKGI